MSDDAHHEIVIIRRGGHGDHDEHHGGVWKIAFADFMTAMMAFFLVMWLISANDKTRASVARYFNPVKLVDATTQPRGLHESKKDESGITASPETAATDQKEKAGKEESKGEAKEAGKDAKDAAKDGAKAEGKAEGKAEKAAAAAETTAAREKRLDAGLRENPFAALAEIAGPLVPHATGRRAGDAFRDPFAPPPPQRPDDEIRLDAPTDDRLASAKAGEEKSGAQASGTEKAGEAKPVDAKTGDDKVAGAQLAEHRPPEAKSDAPHAADKRDDEVRTLAAALRDAGAGRDGPQVAVQRTPEGVLVSLTDTAGFAMFANGSAVPARKLVLLMDGVAGVLKGHAGTVVVRGFTDSKPYKAGRYDNWHLSLDRAQVTHYMLVRGGLSDARIGHVEGYADRRVQDGAEPSSPVNRRIEILLKDAA